MRHAFLNKYLMFDRDTDGLTVTQPQTQVSVSPTQTAIRRSSHQTQTTVITRLLSARCSLRLVLTVSALPLFASVRSEKCSSGIKSSSWLEQNQKVQMVDYRWGGWWLINESTEHARVPHNTIHWSISTVNYSGVTSILRCIELSRVQVHFTRMFVLLCLTFLLLMNKKYLRDPF